MAAIINPKLTDAGKAAAINADANGLQLQITHVALGTGKYDSAATGAGMTAMAGYKESVLVGSGLVTGAGGFRLNIRFLGWAGTPNPYEATELAFWAGVPNAPGSVLFAVYSHPSDVIVQRNSLLYLAQFAFQITDIPAGSVTINMDPDAVAWLGMLTLHEGATNPHPGYVRKIGDTSSGPQLGVTEPQHVSNKAFATTEWVKRSGMTFPAEGGIPITGNMVLTAAQMGRWADIQAPGANVTLPASASVPVGAAIEIRVSASSGLLVAQAGDVINAPLLVAGTTSLQVIQGETVRVSRNGEGVWEVLGTGFRMPAGIISYFAGNTPPPGWLKLNGSTLSRASYPALWLFAQSQGVVTESEWLTGGFSGRFSSGTNGSNFRLPDARGTFIRSLDDGRGIDAGRGWGTFQDHANRSHNHTVYDPGHAHSVYDPGHNHGASTDAQGQHIHNNAHGDGFAYTGSEGFGNNGTSQGLPNFGIGFGSRWSASNGTAAAGSHGHNVIVNAAGSNIAIYGAATGIQIQADGSEARPRNLAFVMCVKF
jgi:hypothetical protein